MDGAHRIWMEKKEIHVTSAVAYGLMAYVAATGDNALMTDYGAEILFETAVSGPTAWSRCRTGGMR